MILYRSRAESRHFTFEAFGSTPEQAHATFMAGIIRHQKQTGANDKWVAEMIEETRSEPINLDVFYRDGEVL